MDNIKLYSVAIQDPYSPDIANWVYLDLAAARAKFDELVAVEIPKAESYDYITLREFPAGGDMVEDGHDILEWSPKKHAVIAA